MKKLILLFIVAGMMTFAVQGEARGVAYDKKGRPVSYSRHYKRGSRGNVFFYKLSRNWQYLYDGSVATGRIMKVNTVCLRNNRLYFTYERTVRTEKGVRSTVDSRKFYRRDGRALRREEITSYCYDPASGLRTRSRDVIIYKLDGSRLQNSFYLSWDKNAYITRREKLVYDASGRKSRVSSRTVTREAGSVSVRVSDSDYEYFKDGAAEKTLITREEMFKCRGKLVYVLEEKIEKSGQEEKIVTEKINYENGVMVSRENIVEEPVPGGVNVIRRVVYDFKENKEYSYVNNDLVREIFYDGTGNVLEKKEYEYTSAELSAVYYYNGDGKLLKKEQSNGSVYTYYAGSQKLESESHLFEYPYPEGKVTYIHYMDEGIEGQDNGRADKKVRMEGSIAAQGHEYGMEYEYYGSTGNIKEERRYYHADYADPSSASFSRLLEIKRFSEDGTLFNRRIFDAKMGRLTSYYYEKDSTEKEPELTGTFVSLGGDGDMETGYAYIYYNLDGTEYKNVGNWHLEMSSDGSIVWDAGSGEEPDIFLFRSSDRTVSNVSNSAARDSYSRISANGSAVWASDLGDGYSINFLSLSGIGAEKIFETHAQSITGMSDWHLDNWIPKISPNGRYATWVDYQSSSRGGDIYLFDSSNGQVIQVTDDGKKYRRPQVDDYGNMIWQDNRGYAGHIYIRKGDSGEVVRISEEGNKMGWDPQLNNGFAAWQSQGDIMYYDFALDRRTNLESIGGFGVHDWDPQIDASGNVGWKGGPLWDGTDIYYYDSDKNEVISLLDDDTQDTVLMINDENGFMLWQKHFSDGRKNLYLYDKNKVILLAENISMSSGRRGAYVAGNGDVLWVSGGIVYRYDYLDGTTVVLSDDFSDPAGTFAMNNRGDIAWRGSDNLYAARQYEARLYPGNGNFKRLRHDSGEIIEFYDTQRNRIALVYSPGEKVYRTYTWNDEDDTVKVKKYAGEYLFSNDILSGVEEQKMISETVYFTSGIDDPFKEKGEWEYVSKVEYLYSYDLSGKIIKREYACPGSEGYTKEYMLNGVYTVNPVLIRKKKTVDSEKETVYRVVHNEDARDVTVTFYFYEDNRDEDEAWNKFRLGVPGESVYIKDEYCGSHLEKRFIYVTDEDIDAESKRISWDSAVPLPYPGESLVNKTVYEIDLKRYSIYYTHPHFTDGRSLDGGASGIFTWYDSGRVRSMVEPATDLSRAFDWYPDPSQKAFTKAEEATGRKYIYADEDFYPEESLDYFIKDMVYLMDAYSDLKEYLYMLNPGEYGSIHELIRSIPGEYSAQFNDVLLGMHLTAPYETHGRLIKEILPDGTYKQFEYYYGTDKIKSVKKYTIDGILISERVQCGQGDNDFIKLGNVPWVRYGQDIGEGSEWHGGFSRGRSGYENLAGDEELRAVLKKWQGSCVRIFLFCDMRSGVEFNSDGYCTGLTDYVEQDMRTLLSMAKEMDIKLMPVLFDYRVADGKEYEFVDLIQDPEKADSLVHYMGEFFDMVSGMEDADAIYAWDVMNEPEMAGEGHHGDETGLTTAEMNAFVRKFVKRIHESDDDFLVTAGSLTKEEMINNWIIPDNAPEMEENKKLDIYQFHYYDSSVEWHDTDMERLDYHKQTISDYDERALLDGKPVIAGEIDPTYVEDKLDTLANHGYDGVLFWDDKGNVFDAAEHREALDWTPGTVRTFYEGSRRVRTVAEPDLEGDGSVYRYYFDESIYNSGTEYEHGRTYLEVKSEVNEFGSKAYEYVYFDNDPFTPEVKYEYHTVDLTDRTNPLFSGLVASYEYDDTGNLLKKKWHSTYYANTWRQRTWRDEIPDSGSNTYKHFVNENFMSMGIGRMDIACGLYGKHSDNTDEVTAKTFEYFEDSGKVKKINKYSYCLFKDNDPNTLPSVSGFIASEEFTYYSDTGNRRSMSISEPDEHCVKYRFYFNEEHNGNPGREQAEHKDYGSWTEAVLYEYWEGPEDDDRFQRHWVHHYQSINYSDPDVPVLSGYQISDEYDIDGNYIRSVEICPGDPFIPEGIVAGDESLSLSAQYRELDSKYDALKSKIEQQRDIENAGAAACGEMTGEEGDNLKGALMF